MHRVALYLKWLSGLACPDHPDYEALYFACQQVYDAHVGNLDNPILDSFLRMHGREVARFTDHPGPYPEPSIAMASEAMSYIAWVVAAALHEAAPDLANRRDRDHALLLSAVRDPSVKTLDIVTLNHDTLLERSLDAAGIRFEDGFRRSSIAPRAMDGAAPVRLWRGFGFKKRKRVRLVKVHGSINWWRVRPHNADWREEEFVKSEVVPSRLKGPDGQPWDDPLDARPLILVGTFNKILEYARPFPLDRYVVFRRALKRAECVVVSGYSFRDQAVNGLLIDWFRTRTPTRTLVVIGPGLDPREPPATARLAFARKWKTLVYEGCLIPISARFAEEGWLSVKKRLLAAGTPLPSEPEPDQT